MRVLFASLFIAFPASAKSDDAEELAVRKVQGIGARIKRNDQKEVVEVDYFLAKIDDDDLKGLTAFKSLATLELKRTKITDRGLEHLKMLRKLSHVNLSGTNVTDAVLCKHLAGLPELVELNLGETKVTGEEFTDPNRFFEIDFPPAFFRAPITDAGLRRIGALKNLRKLTLFNSQMSDAGLSILSSSPNSPTWMSGRRK